MIDNETIQQIANQAAALSTKSLEQLRRLHPDNETGTKSGMYWSGVSKAQLIVDILYDQFAVDEDVLAVS